MAEIEVLPVVCIHNAIAVSKSEKSSVIGAVGENRGTSFRLSGGPVRPIQDTAPLFCGVEVCTERTI